MLRLAFLLLINALFSSPPEVIDFGQLKLFQQLYHYESADSWGRDLGEAALKSGLSGFNDSPEIGVFLLMLKEKYQLEGVVETGTYIGATARFFSIYFDEVHTIELFDQYYFQALELLKDRPNTRCYSGPSPQILRIILPEMRNKRLLFYLDAHGQNDWPLLKEMEEISKTHRDNCIVVIDDFKVPGRGDIVYDAYGEHECSYEYVQGKLSQIFSDYSFHYLIPKDISRRAKFIAIPKNWN